MNTENADENLEMFYSGTLSICGNIMEYPDGFTQLDNISCISILPPYKKELPEKCILVLLAGLFFCFVLLSLGIVLLFIGAIWLLFFQLTQSKINRLYIYLNSGGCIAFGSEKMDFLTSVYNHLKESINSNYSGSITFDFSNCQITNSNILNDITADKGDLK